MSAASSRSAPALTRRDEIGSTEGLRGAVILAVIGFMVALAAGALYSISFLPMFLAAGTLVCVTVPVLRWPVATTAAWVLLAGSSPEMWLGDMVGDANAITAVVKMLGLALVVVCIVRYGGCLDIPNPSYAFLYIFIVGLLHGLWPTLTLMDSVRSLIGSVAPFAFSFSKLSRRWCKTVIAATIWTPTFILAFGVLLAGAGWRPFLSSAEGATRLQGSTHPAFLGGFCATAIYACLVELYRGGQQRYLAMTVVNYAILIASGARAPLAAALIVTSVAFFFVRSEHFPVRRRIGLMIGGALLIPVAVALASGSTSIRLLDVLSSNGASLSGRNLIWPFFEAAWDKSPLLGWGIGAGKSVMDPDSLLVKLLGTTAAHNEYLRMGVDGGDIGLALLLLTIVIWVVRRTAHARPSDRFIMRTVFVAFAIHSFTDNTLISATASVMFAWVSAVFARSTLEREQAHAAPLVRGAA